MAFSDPRLRAKRRLTLVGAVRLMAGHWAFALALAVGLAGCVSTSPQKPKPPNVGAPASPAPVQKPAAPRYVQPSRPLQCVPYARARSGIAIYGNARTWYDQAAGRYERSKGPRVGAVIVLGGTPGGHVAVVTAILSPRDILVDHANWANDGAIHLGAPVRDVSEQGDWSAARVWHMASGQLGVRTYPVLGFVLPFEKVSAAFAYPPNRKSS